MGPLRNKNNNLVSTFIFFKGGGGQTGFSSNVLYYFRIGVQGKLKMVNITDKHSLNVYHVFELYIKKVKGSWVAQTDNMYSLNSALNSVSCFG